jgi:nitroimidazol reductase NimA-like FMN-containing flavoprotein (pyridoxamine 5'-phosphate oxidase superfamily)
VGRLAFSGRYGLSVFPVNYQVQQGSVVFRTAAFSTTEEDLRTGIPHAEYQVAFEVDAIDDSARDGWSVLIQGPAHHLDSPAEHDAALATGAQPWAGADREHAIGITPTRVSGRRIRRAG